MARSKTLRKRVLYTLQGEMGEFVEVMTHEVFQERRHVGDYDRVNATTLRKKRAVEPSDSRETPTMLTPADLDFVASFRRMPRATNENAGLIERIEKRLERLLGYANSHNYGDPVGI